MGFGGKAGFIFDAKEGEVAAADGGGILDIAALALDDFLDLGGGGGIGGGDAVLDALERVIVGGCGKVTKFVFLLLSFLVLLFVSLLELILLLALEILPLLPLISPINCRPTL